MQLFEAPLNVNKMLWICCCDKCLYFVGVLMVVMLLSPSNVHLVSTVVGVQGRECIPTPLVSQILRYGMNLKFAPGIPLVKWWRLVTSLTGSRDWCVIIHRTETRFWWCHLKLKIRHQLTLVMKTYFGKFEALNKLSTLETKKLFSNIRKIGLYSLTTFQMIRLRMSRSYRGLRFWLENGSK